MEGKPLLHGNLLTFPEMALQLPQMRGPLSTGLSGERRICLKQCFNGFAYLLVLALGLMVATPSAYGVATLRFTADAGPSISCADGAACDANPIAGAVTFVGGVGVYSLNVTTGLSKPFLLPQLGECHHYCSWGSHSAHRVQ
jgi:hypothetical protein